MTRLRRAVVSAAGIALCASAISLGRDFSGTGLPEHTLSTLELDTGFGRRGEVRSAARGGIRFVTFDRVALDPNGNIVVGGSAMTTGSRSARPCVARFLPDGRLDRTFAGGIVALPVGGWIGGIAVDAAGRVVACGEFRGLRGTERADTTFAAVRLRADGRIDREFSGDGLAEAAGIPLDNGVRAARIDPRDGSILALVSYYLTSGAAESAVIRFADDGSLDTAFGGDGLAEATEEAFSMAIDGQGGVIVGGSTVVRLGPDGFRDMAFGSGGTVKGPHGGDLAGRIAIDGHGRIVLAASGDLGGYAIFRCLPDGTLDASFDGDGRSPVPIAAPRYSSEGWRFLAATTGEADRYVVVQRLELGDVDPVSWTVDPTGTGYIVQAIDPSNLGALAAFVHSDARPVARMNPAINDVVVTPDGSAAIVIGAEAHGPRGRRRTTPLLFRVDLTPRDAVELPDFRLEWTSQPALTARGPDAAGYVQVFSEQRGLRVSVTNDGSAELWSASVSFRLSDDDRLDSSDRWLGFFETWAFAAGATVDASTTASTGFYAPGFTGLTGKRIIAVVNPDGWRPESDTTDNVIVSDPLP